MKARSASAPRQRNETSGKADIRKSLSDDEKRAWLRLIRTPHIGGVTFWELVSHFGSASAALDALPEFAKLGSRISPRSIPSLSAIDAELEKAAAADLTLHACGEPGFPPLLALVEVPPPLIYTKGTEGIWKRPPVAIVGSRNASGAGLKFASEIAADLGRNGYVVVSGLARGIDGAAHRAALSFATCAVLPGGLDVIYPPEHSGLAGEIAKNGLLIGECPPGFLARAQDFPRRNRIISGCCLGVIVVEATERSGSLITARLAGEQSREVFAVPGHPLDPRSAGTNRLIKEGAVVTTASKDVEAVLQPLLAVWSTGDFEQASETGGSRLFERSLASDSLQISLPAAPGFECLDECVRDILPLLSYCPIDVDELRRLTGLEVGLMHAALLSLDLAGRIERHGLRRVALKA